MVMAAVSIRPSIAGVGGGREVARRTSGDGDVADGLDSTF